MLALSSAAATEPVEGPPVFFATDLLPEQICRGERYRIDPIVEVEAFEFVFDIDSDFGDYRVVGCEDLMERIREIRAIARLNDVSQTEAFASSLSDSIKDPLAMTVGVARRPIATVVGLPGGISRYLQGKFFEARKTSGEAMEKLRELRDKEEPESQLESGEAKPSKAARLGSAATKYGKRKLGYFSAMRHWARKMGVDPYSDNAALQEALSRIGWASSLGSFAGDYAMPSSAVFSYAGRAQDLVWSQPPSELERMNEKRLKDLNVDDARRKRFADLDTYSLSEKTSLTLAFADVGPVPGLDALLDLAMEAETKEDAGVMVETVAVLARYRSEVSSFKRLDIRRGMVLAEAANGYTMLPLAIDYLHWAPLVSEALTSESFESDRRELWITGQASHIATDRLRKLGWYLREECLGKPNLELASASK